MKISYDNGQDTDTYEPRYLPKDGEYFMGGVRAGDMLEFARSSWKIVRETADEMHVVLVGARSFSEGTPWVEKINAALRDRRDMI